MNNNNSLIKSGPAKVLLFAGMLVMATGCVQERVTHVRTVYPVAVQAPVPPPLAPAVVPPPQPVELAPAPPPAPIVPLRSAAELDRMLAPIALYPDPLLAQILPAATLPEQVVLVDRFVRQGGDLNNLDAQPWDTSLKALARYPATLRMLDDNLAWTTDLGQAFLNQPADVMDSVQRLRAQARALGNLQSTPQQIVVVNGGIIEILPAAPQVIYVPVYQPELVFVQRLPAPGRLYISFGAAFVVGDWLNHDCDWHRHQVIVWHHDSPRPRDWWSRPPAQRETATVVNNVTVVNNTTIVNQNFTVWRPQNRSGAVDIGDRGWAQPDVRTTVTPTRNDTPPPHQPPIVAETQALAPSRDTHPVAPVREPRPNQPNIQPPPVHSAEVRTSPNREQVKPAAVITVHEPPAVAQRPQMQPAPAASRQPSAAKPVVAQDPNPVTARSNNSRQPLAGEVTSVTRPNAPTAAPQVPRPAAAPVTRQPAAAAPAQRSAAPSVTSRPVANAPVRLPPSALNGIENPEAARQASARGQQSRQAITRPAVSPRRVAPVPSPKANSAAKKRQ